MCYYQPTLIKISKERLDFIHQHNSNKELRKMCDNLFYKALKNTKQQKIKQCFEYKNNKEFKKIVDRDIQIDAEQQTNKTFGRRNDKKNKRQEKCFLQKIRKILASFSNCIERIFTQK